MAASNPTIEPRTERSRLALPLQLPWFGVLWLCFLGGLAVLPPRTEIHKQMILAAFGAVQLLEARLVERWPRGGPAGVVLAKIILSALLIWHTPLGLADQPGMPAVAINSIYWLIFYLPVFTAATYFGALATIAWTTLTALSYLAFLIPAREVYDISATAAINELALRMLFLYLAAVVVNRIVIEMRRQRDLYRQTAAALEVTNRQLRQAQEDARRRERLAALGQLSAGLAHEIRNPLAVIKGSAETLAKNLPAGAALAQELAGYIGTEVNRVNALVTRFLDFARPLRLQCQQLPLAPLLDQAIAEVKASHPDMPVVVQRDYAVELPLLPLDETLSERVFENLLLNAFEALPPAGGTVIVTARQAEEGERNGIVVYVIDSGPGVPPDVREQIFNPFFTTKKSGTGLGLAIVAQIVDQHGGSLKLESPAVGGAAFRVFLPA